MNSKKIITSGLLISGLILGSTSVSLADTTPAPASAQSAAQAAYKAAVAQYKIDITSYRVALINNDINYRAAMEKYWSDWSTTNKAYWAAWATTIGTYRTAETAYDAQLAPLQATHKAARDAAGSAFLAATVGSPTTDQLNAAVKAFYAAAKVADTTYKAAVTSLGVAPVRPVQPTVPVKPVAPVKPADPVKPVAPLKPGK